MNNPQPGAVSKGFIHVIGGVLAINITGTMDVVANTLVYNNLENACIYMTNTLVCKC